MSEPTAVITTEFEIILAHFITETGRTYLAKIAGLITITPLGALCIGGVVAGVSVVAGIGYLLYVSPDFQIAL
jgi:hypothetical protein